MGHTGAEAGVQGAGTGTSEAWRAASRAPRVAMVASLFPPSIGGIQSHTLALAQKLVERGAHVEVVTRIQPGLAARETMGGVLVHRVGLAGAPPAVGSAAFIAAAAAAICRLAPRVDVIHAHQLLSPATAAIASAPLARRPIVLNPHACGTIGDVGVLSASAVGRLRLAAAVRTADAFVAVSRAIRDELAAAGAPPARIWSIPNGVETARFRPAAAAERASLRAALALPPGPLVVYSGRLAPEKGVDVLLDAWPDVLARAPDARLCVVGSGPEEAALRARAARLGVARAVTFAGGVPDTSPWLRAADAAVLPSRTEGMPVALLEAMACALPCVATAVGGSREVLDPSTGWTVPPEEPRALAAALAEALRDPRMAARRGEAARALALERYALDRVADAFLLLYRAVIAQRTGAAPVLAATGPR